MAFLLRVLYTLSDEAELSAAADGGHSKSRDLDFSRRMP